MSTTYKIRPLTPDLWSAFADLFGKLGACNECWCMYWRIGAQYRKQSRAANKRAFHKLVEQGPASGFLAFDGDLTVGWCQLTPRDALPWLDPTWRLKRLDDVPAWRISCFYVRKGYRKKGITVALVEAAIEAAKAAGIRILEAYPLDAELTPSASSTGYLSTFLHPGFRVTARPVLPGPLCALT